MAQAVLCPPEVQLLLASHHLVPALLPQLLPAEVVLAQLVFLRLNCSQIVAHHIEVGSMDIQLAEMGALRQSLSHNFIRD